MTAIEQLTPPDDLIFVGSGDFQATGREFLRYFTELGGLQPWHRVLDVGCGIGRMAVPLAEYLDARGSYEGFDIVPLGVRWCQENITPRYPAFRFRLADISNTSYNPGGRCAASDFVFPYPDADFDFAFLTSVFTHLLPDAVENYLHELARVLKPGGRCLATCFLWNAESAALTRDGRSSLLLGYDRGSYRLADAHTPENAVGYDEAFFLGLFERAGFAVERPVRYGSWCGRGEYLGAHDIVLATRTTAPARRRRPARLPRLARALTGWWRRERPDAADAAVQQHIESRLQVMRCEAPPMAHAATPAGAEALTPNAAERRIGELEIALRQARQTIGQLQSTLNGIYVSRGWRMLNRYYRLRNGLLPPGSRRRALAAAVVRIPGRLWRFLAGKVKP
jgi:SAM-dependent methyltransferase